MSRKSRLHDPAVDRDAIASTRAFVEKCHHKCPCSTVPNARWLRADLVFTGPATTPTPFGVHRRGACDSTVWPNVEYRFATSRPNHRLTVPTLFRSQYNRRHQNHHVLLRRMVQSYFIYGYFHIRLKDYWRRRFRLSLYGWFRSYLSVASRIGLS